MTVLEDVAKLVTRLSPDPVCDDCIAERLGLPADQQAGPLTHELAGSNGFERGKDACNLCGETRLVIRRRQTRG